ncbi:MAG: DUF4402 domain-containing protein [Bacteroidales bacterium]|nr:DUF4402 domain-containing protein [Bacteroidales bacterium]
MTINFCFSQENSKGNSENGLQISITKIKDLSFGSFYPGSNGGTLSISSNGVRSATGTVITLSSEAYYSEAVYEISCPEYSMVHLIYKHTIVMHGSNGGHFKLRTEQPENGKVFAAPANSENGFLISVGGVLEMNGPSFNPPGDYSGTLDITILIE